MTTDNQTNFLYLSNQITYLKKFWIDFEKLLKENKINYSILQGCSDYWTVDFMPIQTADNRFVQFVFNPDYLRNSPEDHKFISDYKTICKSISLDAVQSDLLVDGGNVIRASNKVIMTEKVFTENDNLSINEVIDELKSKLEVEDIIFIPIDKEDITGHADGMVRFIDEYTVLVSDFKKEIALREELISRLKKANLEVVPFVYNPYQNIEEHDAKGIYINYLQMDNLIVLPIFEMSDDEVAIRQIEKAFPTSKILTLNAEEVAKGGGVLNCISWNIKTTNNE
jgi:agmatine deiminase